jgi:ATP-dependent helicase/nuclease subunit B
MSPDTDIFLTPGPRWFTIPSGRCFLDDLAQGLCAALDHRLSDATVLTPTRRGARAMARAFSAQARGKPLLLPQVRAIGDLDEGEPPFDLDALALDLPPALSSLRRRFEMARLITAHYDGDLSGRVALELADSLAGFFDSLALEEVDATDRLDRLIAGEGEDQYRLDQMAEHWQVSARFLNIAVRKWPERLAELGLMDPSQRQVVLIRRLGDQWRDRPPATPLILAGTTGSAPSTADLADIVASAPKGAVALPGLDLSLADDAWRQIEESHPQSTLKRLLDRHNVNRAQVRVWPASLDADRRANARRRLLNEALRPAEATRDWRDQIRVLKAESETAVTDGLDGLFEIQAAGDEEAATAIALLMRETLETPGRTAALITPDITLARRVSARLTRWGLAADSSAGEPLGNSLAGRYLLDLLELVRAPHDPVRLLSLWHNPLSRFADADGAYEVERRGLRGATPNDLAMIAAMLAAKEVSEVAIHLYTDYSDVISGFLAEPVSDLGTVLSRFAALAEAFSRDSGKSLWAGAAGTQASELIAGLIAEGSGYLIEDLAEFADILGHLIRQAKVRTGGNTHPRLLILGAIEARLVKADRLILAGLEEGVWPQAPDLDPFLSRPMRQSLGLPTPERRTGLSAHDFLQAAAAPEAYLITRARREGEPQIQSRWLWRLKTLCKGADIDHLPTRPELLDWARALDCGLPHKPDSLKPARRPEPKPPVDVRPDRLSVTEVELFVRDPYAIYAKKILNLRPMDRPNEPVEARQYGTAIHKGLERFITEKMPLGDAGAAALNGLLTEELAATHLSPAQMALQRPLLPAMARRYVDFEQDRRAARGRVVVEKQGEMTFEIAARPFTLIAKADRLEADETAVDILDFKTGLPPTPKSVLAGYYPQLTLTAAIVLHGGFTGIDLRGRAIGELIYVRVAPDKVEPKIVRDRETNQTPEDMAHVALARLKSRLEAYAKSTKGYKSWTAPQFLKNRAGDYDQLARLYEWYVLGDDEPSEIAEDAE